MPPRGQICPEVSTPRPIAPSDLDVAKLGIRALATALHKGSSVNRSVHTSEESNRERGKTEGEGKRISIVR